MGGDATARGSRVACFVNECSTGLDHKALLLRHDSLCIQCVF